MIQIMEAILVFLFGLLVMVWLLDIRMTPGNLLILAGFSAGLLAVQGVLYVQFGAEFVYKLYPFITHLPLLLVFVLVFRRSVPVSLFVLSSAYVFTTPRKWLGEWLAIPFGQTELSIFWCQQIVSVGLLVLIYLFVRPAMKKILNTFESRLWIVMAIPLAYYVLCYIMTVYTDSVMQISMMMLGFLASLGTVIFYLLLILYFNEISASYELRNDRNSLDMEAELVRLRAEYLTKMRSTYCAQKQQLYEELSGIRQLLTEARGAEAQEKLLALTDQVKQSVHHTYCANEALDPVLWYYDMRAQERGIPLCIQATIGTSLRIRDDTLLLLFSCAIEYALHLYPTDAPAPPAQIRLLSRTQRRKLLLEIKAPCRGTVACLNGLPVDGDTAVRNLAMLVANCNGVCSVIGEPGLCTLRVIL